MSAADAADLWSARLSELGIELPPVVKPAGRLCARGAAPAISSTPRASCRWWQGSWLRPARSAADVTPEEGKALARICALNALAAVDSLVGIDAITRVVKVVGFVASAPGFNGQPGVVNGASELFGEVFGEAGAHARSAVGVAELPLDAPVEVELIVEVVSVRRPVAASRLRIVAPGDRHGVGAAVQQPRAADAGRHQHLGAARSRAATRW